MNIGDKDLENLISGIGQEEQAVAQKQAQIDRLKQLIQKQQAELKEQQKLVQDLQDKVKNMYDLPADVEELKRMVGEQRADLNTKDQQLEMSYGQMAGLEAELKNTRLQTDTLAKNLDTYISQVGELKSRIVELQSMNKLKDQELKDLSVKNESYDKHISKMEADFKSKMAQLQQQYTSKVGDMTSSVSDTYTQIGALKSQLAEKDAKMTMYTKEIEDLKATLNQSAQYSQEIQNQLSDLKTQLREKDASIIELKNKTEGKMKEELFSAKGEFAQKISKLETDILDREMKYKEAKSTADNATRQASEIKAKLEELMAKNEELNMKQMTFEDEIKQKYSSFAELQDFKNKNANVVVNLQGLAKLFEQEPLFKSFNIVRKVGEISIEDLKSALGVPSVTTNKYVQQFIAADVFEIGLNGKITLKHKL